MARIYRCLGLMHSRLDTPPMLLLDAVHPEPVLSLTRALKRAHASRHSPEGDASVCVDTRAQTASRLSPAQETHVRTMVYVLTRPLAIAALAPKTTLGTNARCLLEHAQVYLVRTVGRVCL